MSPDPYFDVFEEELTLTQVNLSKHATAGLSLYESNGQIHLASISPSTAAAKIPGWRTRIRGAWLIKIGDTVVASIEDAVNALRRLVDDNTLSVKLLFSHPEIRPSLSNKGLPIVSSAPFSQQVHGQMNTHWEFITVAEHIRSSKLTHQVVESGGVMNMVNRVMKLTRGKLLKQPDWNEWHDSEFLQLDQYYNQGMFGVPQHVDEDAAVFHTVWTYAIKALDG